MEHKRSFPFLSYVMAIIIGAALIKEFDFETLRFENFWLALVYMITVGFLAYFIVKAHRGGAK
jgi:hypothetical protein